MRLLRLVKARFLLFSVVCFLLTDKVYAGAWLLKKHHSEFTFQHEYKAITSFYHKQGSEDSLVSKIYSLQLFSLDYQYGFNDDVTLGTGIKFFNNLGYHQSYYGVEEDYSFFHEFELRQNNYYNKFENKIDEAKFFLRRKLWSSENAVISFQPSFLSYNNNNSQALELSLQYGYGFEVFGKHSYINLELLANQVHNESQDQNFIAKYELNSSFGVDLNKKETIMIQLYNKLIVEQQSNVRLYNIQLSLLHKFNNNIYFQTGYMTNLNHRKDFLIESVITGIWLKF